MSLKPPHILCLTVIAVLLQGGVLLASPSAMKAPPGRSELIHAKPDGETSSVKLVFLEAITLFQKRLSPLDGPRCMFTPTCSHYGYRAVQEYGPVRGIMMTGDRLIRCNGLHTSGLDYPKLPNGSLYDPIQNNVLFEKHK